MFDVILDTWSEGGIVLLPIFLCAFWGFVLLLRTWIRMGRGKGESGILPRFEALAARLDAGDIDGARAEARRLPGAARQGALLALDNRHLPEPALRVLLEEKLSYRLFEMERHIPLIESLAAAAPLLGLLGTVSGLIHTFRAMKEFGSGNAQLLSRGISEALIAAQTGLLVAILLILAGRRLEGRIHWLKDQTEYGITMLLNLAARAPRGNPSSPSSPSSERARP